jgi:hypothetical protein
MNIGPLPIPTPLVRLLRVVVHESTAGSRLPSEPRRPARVLFYTRRERRTADARRSG